MFCVVVDFDVKPEFSEEFIKAMMEQAKNSKEKEQGCHHFDVCCTLDDPTKVFLYELYTDKHAFDLHLASDHFKEFDRLVADWIAMKTVRLLTQLGDQ